MIKYHSETPEGSGSTGGGRERGRVRETKEGFSSPSFSQQWEVRNKIKQNHPSVNCLFVYISAHSQTSNTPVHFDLYSSDCLRASLNSFRTLSVFENVNIQIAAVKKN